ncbi:lysylphosphatidylglycerol synthase transmembrane domain-containing protein [Nonlabens ponticola]|uniref:Flippase-like domain-containing protein n=1 Tax=Nonlabens ponticola TaxID=2496866 RepID=A0A3S9MVJ5_9FLAO|nr:lysylphosphatidylglycerol synthase transmembrane domain-containing protein [Nonlabens ponticola]AZQ43246.1 flippase-like domain-containing protein [Nonlabens ponticola]
MKKAFIKTLKILLPLALGIFLIIISYNQFTAAQLEEIKGYLIQADYRFIALGMLFALLSHLSRAWRWSYMLSALGIKPNFVNNMIAIGSGYAMNLIIPRSGELSRALIVKETDDIPVDQGLGTIIAERVLDFVILLAITATAILTASDKIIDFFKDGLNSAFAKANSQQLLYIAIALVIAAIIAFWLIKKFELGQKIKVFLNGLKEGFETIWTMQHKWYYLAHTLFIWAMYLLMFYICIYAIPDTDSMSISALLCAFAAGSFAVAFTNGGFGAYPYLISNVLVIFGYTQVVGTAFGWIVWLSQTLLVVILGLICFALFSWRKKTAQS